MDCEWDEAKAASNLRKHGVDFADAVGVFDDPLALSIPDDGSDEDRFIAIGSDFLGRVLVVVYAHREERIRVISARKATSTERTAYEEDRR
jgi:uncharacterized DUF497 family protein